MQDQTTLAVTGQSRGTAICVARLPNGISNWPSDLSRKLYHCPILLGTLEPRWVWPQIKGHWFSE